MNDRHRAAGSRRPELFPEEAILERWHRRMINAAGIDRDLVPTTNRIEPPLRRDVGLGGDILRPKLRPISLVMAIKWAGIRVSGEACDQETEDRRGSYVNRPSTRRTAAECVHSEGAVRLVRPIRTHFAHELARCRIEQVVTRFIGKLRRSRAGCVLGFGCDAAYRQYPQWSSVPSSSSTCCHAFRKSPSLAKHVR